ncbi:MAG: hypothetical protein ACREDP_06295 [Bradyrhizobium sp.]
MASTISRDDIIAVIGASSPWPAAGGEACFLVPAAGGGELCCFDFWLIAPPLPTKRAGAKASAGKSKIVDIVID